MNYHPTIISNFTTQLNTEGSVAYSIEGGCTILQAYSRKNLYKISLLSGTGSITYGNRTIEINGSVLLITKPGSVCTWSILANHHPSYTCVLTREFMKSRYFRWVNQCKPFSSSDAQVHNLDPEESRFLGSLFHKMVDSQDSTYPFRSDLIRDQICVLLHTAVSMKPSENYVDSVSPLKPVSRHVELVEMQFPSKAQVLHFN